MSASYLLKRAFQELRADPRRLAGWLKAALRGTVYAAYYRVFRSNVRIKLPFLVSARVSINGPGSVTIDRGCAVHWNVFDGLNITTLNPDASVEIGPRCNLGGVTLRCGRHIEIGDQVMFANCLIQDVPFWSVTAPGGAPVEIVDPALPEGIQIGSQSWLTNQTIVLGHSRVGEQSVMSLGGMCCQQAVPDKSVAFGNPLNRFLSIERIEKLLRAQ